MARLHESQGKSLLAAQGIRVPRGRVASTPEEAAAIAAELGGPCIVKIQAWTTGRAALGGVAKAASPAEASAAARRMLGMSVSGFPVTQVLVEECAEIAAEAFLSITIDDRARAPVMLIAASGGTGIEERASEVARVPCNVQDGPDRAALDRALAPVHPGAPPGVRSALADAAARAFRAARVNEARSLEINPLAITRSGDVIALDCRVTIDDYAAVRHPELGIDFARELDHPPTALERLAYRIEQEDHRGTFFFAELPRASGGPGAQPSPRLVGFHGAGGGGSMMSMDALAAAGFTPANFCDTSGNPSPAKVYRAARVILAQPGLVAYFGSGSGVANQEQFWSAYGLAKAFWELNLDIPAVIRLGGNSEDRAVDILEGACRAAALPATVEGYRKSDPPARIAARLDELVRQRPGSADAPPWSPRAPRRPAFVGAPGAVSFEVRGGRAWINPAAWARHPPDIMARAPGLFRDDSGRPALAVPPEEFASKDSEMIACEVECRRAGIDAVFVDLPMERIDGPAL